MIMISKNNYRKYIVEREGVRLCVCVERVRGKENNSHCSLTMK